MFTRGIWVSCALALSSLFALPGCSSAPLPDDGPSIVQEDGAESEALTENEDALRRECRTASDCPKLDPRLCRICPDGVTNSCLQPACVAGACRPVLSECPAMRTCGGFTGQPCPVGQQCIDDPRDNCDPNAGGSDCSGICVKQACDPRRICGQTITCVDGKLYPTACGPSNCDAPIGACSN
jgi:hypothetical protein